MRMSCPGSVSACDLASASRSALEHAWVCVLECAMDAPRGAREHPKHVLGRSERQHPVRKKLLGCKCLVSTAG